MKYLILEVWDGMPSFKSAVLTEEKTREYIDVWCDEHFHDVPKLKPYLELHEEGADRCFLMVKQLSNFPDSGVYTELSY